MAGEGFILGAACLLCSESSLVLEVQKQAKWVYEPRGVVRIGVGCIGGALRTGEDLVDGLQRGCVEEVGCRAHLRSAPATLEVTPEGALLEREWPEAGPRPALLWEDTGPGSMPGGKVAVFLGEAAGRPEPRDLPALLLVDHRLLWVLTERRLTLTAALDEGVGLRTTYAIPPQALLEPVGTPAMLARLRRAHPATADDLVRQVFAAQA